MTRKDFVLIAKVLKDARDLPIEIRETGKKIVTHDDLLAEKMAYALRSTNDMFDTGRFLEACGVTK